MDGEDQDPVIATRLPELLVALFLAAIGTMVVADSVWGGRGGDDAGPLAGSFPFYIGLGLLGAGLWTAVTQLRQWKAVRTFSTRSEAKQVLAVLWPMVIYVAAIKLLGIYLASALLIGWFMARHGAHGWPMRIGVSVGVPLLFFAVFERWFLVPLAKGPSEALLGF